MSNNLRRGIGVLTLALSVMSTDASTFTAHRSGPTTCDITAEIQIEVSGTWFGQCTADITPGSMSATCNPDTSGANNYRIKWRVDGGTAAFTSLGMGPLTSPEGTWSCSGAPPSTTNS